MSDSGLVVGARVMIYDPKAPPVRMGRIIAIHATSLSVRRDDGFTVDVPIAHAIPIANACNLTASEITLLRNYCACAVTTGGSFAEYAEVVGDILARLDTGESR